MELYFMLLAATVGGYVFCVIKTDLGGESQVRGVKTNGSTSESKHKSNRTR